MRSALTVTTLLTVAALAAPASAWAGEGDIIVKRDPGLDYAQRAAVRKRADVRLVEALPLPRTELVAPRDGDVAAALGALRHDPAVVYAEPDARVHALAVDDPRYPYQWALENTGQTVFSYYDNVNYTSQVGLADADIDAPEAWLRSRGSGVTVGVVDTGIDATQPDLAGQVDASLGYDWVDHDAYPADEHGHGTHVAGTIAALAGNGIGVAGVAPQAKLVALRVLDANASGFTSDVAAAFAYAGQLGLRIVNASLGGGYSSTVAQAIAQYPNTLYVVAAGNGGVDGVGDSDDDAQTAEYPCALPSANLLCVGASDNLDQPAIFSNFGPFSVDLFAPGVGIWSTFVGPGEHYEEWDGTSMASPHVAGAAALALAVNPTAPTAQLRAALLGSVDHPAPLASVSATGGRLNADAAVQAIGTATPTPVPTPTPVVTPVPTPPPPPPPEPPARLTSIRISGSLRTRTGRLRVNFSLTRAAYVRFTVTRRGHRRPLAGWTRQARGGDNVMSFTHRLPTRQTLKPGSYTLALRLDTSAKSARFSVR